ncbi:MAG: DUF1294 domain-containing protein [Prevotella sp.]|nr:DUF1294 domain-containing protein [Prevotella sp.]
MNSILLYYIIGVNVIAFMVYGIEKLKARKGKWRISEYTLLLLAVAGGSIGSYTPCPRRHFNKSPWRPHLRRPS